MRDRGGMLVRVAVAFLCGCAAKPLPPAAPAAGPSQEELQAELARRREKPQWLIDADAQTARYEETRKAIHESMTAANATTDALNRPKDPDILAAECDRTREGRLAERARRAAAAAERATKADEARARADYIKKNCRTLMKAGGPPQACVDDEGYYRDCSAVPEVYIQCPSTGPKGLRGVIGSVPITMTTADPSRIARVVSSRSGHPSEPTDDEKCADRDRQLVDRDRQLEQDALVKRIQDGSHPPAPAPTAP